MSNVSKSAKSAVLSSSKLAEIRLALGMIKILKIEFSTYSHINQQKSYSTGGEVQIESARGETICIL